MTDFPSGGDRTAQNAEAPQAVTSTVAAVSEATHNGTAPSPFVAFLAAEASGIDFLADLHRRGISQVQLNRVGISPATAKRWISSAQLFCAPARSAALIHHVQATARGKHFGLEVLCGIAKQVLLLNNTDRGVQLNVLLDVLEKVEGSYSEIIAQTTHIVRRTNAKLDDEQAKLAKSLGAQVPPKIGKVYGGRTTDAAGYAQLFWELPEEQMAELISLVDQAVKDYRRRNPQLGFSQARSEVLLAAVRNAFGHGPRGKLDLGCETAPGAASTPPVQPLIVISVEDYTDLLRGKGQERRFICTDGREITGAEIIRRGLSDHRYFAVHSHDGEPLNLYETVPSRATDRSTEGLEATLKPVPGSLNTHRHRRTANRKQRIMLAAMYPICPWPGCNTPAEDCQIHHVTAWLNGGNTNMDNMSTICPVHNGMNDDNPNRPRNGRLVNTDWDILYQPPDGGPPWPNKHPAFSLSAVAIAKRQRPVNVSTEPRRSVIRVLNFQKDPPDSDSEINTDGGKDSSNKKNPTAEESSSGSVVQLFPRTDRNRSNSVPPDSGPSSS